MIPRIPRAFRLPPILAVGAVLIGAAHCSAPIGAGAAPSAESVLLAPPDADTKSILCSDDSMQSPQQSLSMVQMDVERSLSMVQKDVSVTSSVQKSVEKRMQGIGMRAEEDVSSQPWVKIREGKRSCPCIGVDFVRGKTPATVSIDGGNGTAVVEFPAGVGTQCRSWETKLHPDCIGKQGGKADFCHQRWCYVDPCNCDLDVKPQLSHYFPDARYQNRSMYFSYDTCGDHGHDWSADSRLCMQRMTEAGCLEDGACKWDSWRIQCTSKDKEKDAEELASLELNCGKEADEEVDSEVVGNVSCPCIGITGTKGYVIAAAGPMRFNMSSEVGSYCRDWDRTENPGCETDAGGNMPNWCKRRFCYVDPCNCKLPIPPKPTSYFKGSTFQGKPVYYSFATCGTEHGRGGIDVWDRKDYVSACVNQKTKHECATTRGCDWDGPSDQCLDKSLLGKCPGAEVI